jgi:hypothetical protein
VNVKLLGGLLRGNDSRTLQNAVTRTAVSFNYLGVARNSVFPPFSFIHYIILVLGAFEKFKNAIINFAMYVGLCTRPPAYNLAPTC